MKISNILVFLGVFIISGFLLAHDYSLKASFLSKSYLNPLLDYDTSDFKNFSSVDLNSTRIYAKIVQGPFKVMIEKDAEQNICIRQENGHLVITYKMKKGDNFYWREKASVYISCPILKSLNTNKIYQEDEIHGRFFDSSALSYMPPTILHGFISDSLIISEDFGSRIKMDSNKIGWLYATLGSTKNTAPVLEIAKGNQINSANIDVESKSEFTLESIIPNLEYRVDENARIILSGEVSNYMNKK